MDGLKLEKWKKAFEKEVKKIEVEYDNFLLPKKFEETYQLKMDEPGHILSLWIDTDNLPQEIEKRLAQLLLETEPEDSV